MNQKHYNATRRAGFTLIELLVVIAIIAILAGLLLAGVMVFMRKGPEVQTRNELLQLSQALQKFKADKGQYPPNLIRLRANMRDYLPAAQGGKRLDALDDASVTYLRSVMWKNLLATTDIQWAGPGVNFGTTFPNGVVLEGDQCLVFFLLGPPNVAANGAAGMMGGFNNDPQNPVGATPTPIRYMDPPPVSRLVNRRIASTYPNGHPFPSYLDGYDGAPYMYFSSTNSFKRPNGYDTFANSLDIRPYAKDAAKTQFYNPDSFQLISAGPDGSLSERSTTPPTFMPPRLVPADPNVKGGFGPGGYWIPGTVTGDRVGADDVSNFHDKALGNP